MRVCNVLMRTVLCVAMALASLASSYAADNVVCLHLRSGEKIYFAHEDRPILVFGDDNELTLRDDKMNVTVSAYDQLHKLTFGTTASINDVMISDGRSIEAIGDRDIALVGFAAGTPVSVVSAAGVCVMRVTVADAYAVVSLAALPSGTYIVTVAGYTYKIALK